MNIFDSAWAKLYLHDERHNISYPMVGTALSMSYLVGMYIIEIIHLPKVFGWYKLPHLTYIPFVILFVVLFLTFLLRNRKKEAREKRLSLFKEYSAKYPKKEKTRFWGFVITPHVLFILDLIISHI